MNRDGNILAMNNMEDLRPDQQHPGDPQTTAPSSRQTVTGASENPRGAGMIIAGVLMSLKNLWSPGLIIVGEAAGYVGYWITKNVK